MKVKTDADGRPGGDGVGFVFHTGKVDTIGQSGASIGMGTIKNAFGFKLDSWHNTSNPNANQNASADPKYGNGRKVNGEVCVGAKRLRFILLIKCCR